MTASAIAVAIILAIGGLGWALRDRAARQTVLDQQIAHALQEVETFHQSEKPTEAMSAIKRAEGLLASGHSSDELANRVKQWRTDLETVERLDQIRLDEAVPEIALSGPEIGIADKGGSGSGSASNINDDDWNNPAADAAYRQEFARFGLDLDALEVDRRPQIIRNSPICKELVAALDNWFHVRRVLGSFKNKASTDGNELLEIARRADPDPWRDRLRYAIQCDDAETLAKLATDADVLEQPLPTVLLLALALHHNKQYSQAIEILQAVQRRHPGDFWVNAVLADRLSRIRPARPDEAVEFQRIAVALRPTARRLCRC